MIETVKDLSTIALRKAQLSIEYALGQPEYLDITVSEYLTRDQQTDESLIVFLARIRRLMQEIAEPRSMLNRKTIIERTGLMIDAASELVPELLGDKT